MAFTMTPAIVHVKAVESVGGLLTVTASGYSGLEVAGTLGGIVGSVVAVIALVTSVAAGNAKRRRQYDDDMRSAEARGAAGVRAILEPELDELREIRTRYYNMLEARGPAAPPPPG